MAHGNAYLGMASPAYWLHSALMSLLYYFPIPAQEREGRIMGVTSYSIGTESLSAMVGRPQGIKDTSNADQVLARGIMPYR